MIKKKELKVTHIYKSNGMQVTFIKTELAVDQRTIVSVIMYMLEFDIEEEITADTVTEKIYHLFYWRGCDFFDSFELNASYLQSAESIGQRLFPHFFNNKK
jgi:hypothetical protein